MQRLSGKVAVVTGAGMGLGEAIALAYAREGARVVVADLNDGAGSGVVEAIEGTGGDAAFVHADVRREDDVAAAVALATERWGGLDILVNNAGIAAADRDEFLALDAELWDDIIAVNLRSVFFGIKHAIPPMVERGGGAIVSMASIGALNGYAGGVAYGAAKAGIVKMTIVAAARYAKDGIRANAIAPGMMLTPLSQQSTGGRSSEESAALFSGLQPLPLAGRAEDIADAAVFLASEESRFVTGQTLVVDGGLIMAGWGSRLDSFSEERRRQA